MHAFKYKGIESDGQKTEGTIEAQTMDEAERRLAARNITLLAITQSAASGKTKTSQPKAQKFKLFGGKVKEAEAAAILDDLAVMAETGIPFVEALDGSIESARSPQIKAGLRRVKDAVVGGRALGEALGEAGMFPVVVREMVRVAEEGGRLEEALSGAAKYMERSADLKKRISAAMIYPMILFGISLMAIGVIIAFVLPRFAGIFEKMKVDIPATTQVILATGEFVRGNPVGTVAIIIVVIIGGKFAASNPVVRARITAVAMRLPIMGPIIVNLAISRAFQSIATLLNGNVALLLALEQGAKVSGNDQISSALMQARDRVRHGATLTDSLAETGKFPLKTIQVVSIGERTGRLGQLMAGAGERMEEDVDTRIKSLVSVIEPLMILFMGGFVGFVTISIISPIYSVIETIK